MSEATDIVACTKPWNVAAFKRAAPMRSDQGMLIADPSARSPIF